MNVLLDGELDRFETWARHRGSQRTGFQHGPLISLERGMIKAYLFYAATERPVEGGGA